MPDEVVQQEVEGSTQDQAIVAPEYVPKADFDKLAGELGSLKTAYAEAGKRLEVIDRVAEMLVGKQDTGLSKEEQVVVGELKRLMPHILPNAKALESLPQIAKTVEAAGKAAADSLAQAAFGFQLELQGAAGLPVDNPKLNRLIGSGIKDWINEDRSRTERFWRGDKTVIEEGFKDIQKDALATLRRGEKQAVVQTVQSRPRNSGPSGSGQPGTGETTSVDFSDKKSVRAAFRAALAS